jgi:hypothetical protein
MGIQSPQCNLDVEGTIYSALSWGVKLRYLAWAEKYNNVAEYVMVQ